MKSVKFAFSLFLFTLVFIITGCNKNTSDNSLLGLLLAPEQGNGTLKLTFHDTPLKGTNIEKVNINVIETQIVDFYDHKIVISNETKSFDLLQLTSNNPVVLAHTSVPAGTYKQIRLILDNNSSLEFTDHTTAPLTVPSAEQTGIKIDGIFTIPEGKLYTLDIDLDPSQSIHYASGKGWMLKPVIALTGLDVIYGTFNFETESKTNGVSPLLMQIKSDTTISFKHVSLPKLSFNGKYIFDGLSRKFTLRAESVSCPTCNSFEELLYSNFIPKDISGVNNEIYSIMTWGQDYIIFGNDENMVKLNRVDYNDFDITSIKNINVKFTGLPYPGNYAAITLLPKSGKGKAFSGINKISSDNSVNVDFNISVEDISSGNNEYYISLGVVSSKEDLYVSPITFVVSDMKNAIDSKFYSNGILINKNTNFESYSINF